MYSIVIPCRNGEQTLSAQLDALLAQACAAPFEIVVADNGSTDGTRALVERYHAEHPAVRRVDASGRAGINHARNCGVRAATGSRILLCDADDVVQPGWLAAHHAAFESGAACVGGSVDRVLPDGTLVSSQRELYFVGHDIPSPIGANCGFTREVFVRVDGFDEGFVGGGDETDFFWRAHRAGYPTVLVADALIVYALRPEIRQAARQFVAYGRGLVRLYRAHGEHGMPRSSTLRAVLALFACLGIIATSTPRSLRRRYAVERLAGRYGRLRESIRTRTLYL
ncbi:glycosyltransferase [Plantibacter flavus]|uniref:glycosyltransferase family 2 protein n=1 Tax=Plantibacter flavus TaxID=150123 RepID=UPI003F174306